MGYWQRLGLQSSWGIFSFCVWDSKIYELVFSASLQPRFGTFSPCLLTLMKGNEISEITNSLQDAENFKCLCYGSLLEERTDFKIFSSRKVSIGECSWEGTKVSQSNTDKHLISLISNWISSLSLLTELIAFVEKLAMHGFITESLNIYIVFGFCVVFCSVHILLFIKLSSSISL